MQKFRCMDGPAIDVYKDSNIQKKFAKFKLP